MVIFRLSACNCCYYYCTLRTEKKVKKLMGKPIRIPGGNQKVQDAIKRMEKGTLLLKKDDLKKMMKKQRAPPRTKPHLIRSITLDQTESDPQSPVHQSPVRKMTVDVSSPTRKSFPPLLRNSSISESEPVESPAKRLLKSPLSTAENSPLKSWSSAANSPAKSALKLSSDSPPKSSLMLSPANSPAKSSLKSPKKSPVKLPNIMKQMSAMATVVKAAGKFRKAAKPKWNFNFEKFLSYLENMRPVVGFQILNTIVTWDLVSTIIFLLFSILAVFVQESIFGSSKSNTHTK